MGIALRREKKSFKWKDLSCLHFEEAEQIKRKAFIIHLKKEGKGGEKGEMNVRWIAVLLVLSALAITPVIALDTTPPRVFNQSASPSEIANDGGEYSELTVHVVDNTAIDDVTIDLTPIGGGIVHMICKGNYTKNGEVVSIFNWTTNTTCPPGIYSLKINVTDIAGNHDDTASITLGVSLMADSLGVDDASGSPGSYVEVPVIINNTKNGPIESIGFYIEYDKSVINLTEERIKTGDLTSDWVCMPEIGEDKDLIMLVGMLGTPIANGSTGSVAILNFSVIGNEGDSSPINITEIRMKNVAEEEGTAPPKNATFSVGLWGDLNNNGIPADRDDVMLMLKAYLGFIEPDERYDLNNNGIPADRDDVMLMLKAYLGFI